jgi:succinyl-CoA synthetase beta subunit
VLNIKSLDILEKSNELGWVQEPDAKALMKENGLDIPQSVLTNDIEKARQFLEESGGPVVAKAVSKKIMHKTEFNAVATHITSPDQLKIQMERLKKLDGCTAVLVEQMIQGIEVIVGAKNDYQFGPVIVFGIGGTSVEIYKDTAIRMAPLNSNDVLSMVHCLVAKKIVTGYRGHPGVNIPVLTDLMVLFSHLVMDMEDRIDSVDLNPVICTQDQCVIADARIILQ